MCELERKRNPRRDWLWEEYWTPIGQDEASHAQHAGVQHQGSDERISARNRAHAPGDQGVGAQCGFLETHFP